MRFFIAAILRASLAFIQHSLFIEAAEQVFVDVFANESFNIRTLDVPVATAVGAANLFLKDPMDAHDFASVKRVTMTLEAELAASNTQTIAGRRIQSLAVQLQPLFQVLPKNEHGRLSNGTVLYALHRLFTETHGWSIKGLEPGSEAWLRTMSVTSTVRQTSKYIIPTFLHDLLFAKTSGKGLDLVLLAVLAATIHHLVRAELLQTLRNVFTTLHLPTAGVRTETQTEDILSTYMMAFAFGINLEVSELDDIIMAREFLASHHAGWKGMKELISGAQQEVLTNADVFSDFGTLVQIAAEIGDRYMEWQRHDCTYAKTVLEGLATENGSFAMGRLPLANMPPESVRSRPLFGEAIDSLRSMGALDESIRDQPQVVLPNYMTSHSMCLTTSTYYAVCCPNECGQVLKLAEAAGSSAAPSGVFESLAPMKAEANVNAFTLASLEKIATATGGTVALHSRDFAHWLHSVFPRICPAPSAGAARFSSPRTPDEWMMEQGTELSDLEAVMDQMTLAISRYTSMGTSLEDKHRLERQTNSLRVEGHDVELILSKERHLMEALGAVPRKSSILQVFVYCVLMVSMVGFACAAGRSGLQTCNGQDVKKTLACVSEWA